MPWKIFESGLEELMMALNLINFRRPRAGCFCLLCSGDGNWVRKALWAVCHEPYLSLFVVKAREPGATNKYHWRRAAICSNTLAVCYSTSLCLSDKRSVMASPLSFSTYPRHFFSITTQWMFPTHVKSKETLIKYFSKRPEECFARRLHAVLSSPKKKPRNALRNIVD